MSYLENYSIKIGIIIRSEIVRKGLVRLLQDRNSNCSFKIVIENSEHEGITEHTGVANFPDVIIVSVKEYLLISKIRTSYPNAKVLLIGIEEIEKELNYMFQFEIKGGLFYNSSLQELYRSIEILHKDGYYYSNEVAGIMAQKINGEETRLTRTPITSIWASLAIREKEFVRLACTDLTYNQIADRLNLSPKTIDKYRATVFEKFKVTSRVGLAIFAIKFNLVKL
jgi:two-component system, NarL family, invasion response regulator UvrY